MRNHLSSGSRFSTFSNSNFPMKAAEVILTTRTAFCLCQKCALHIYLFIYAFIAMVFFVQCPHLSFMLYQFLRSRKTNRMIRLVNNNLFICISVKCVKLSLRHKQNSNNYRQMCCTKPVCLAQTERHTYREEKCVKHEETMNFCQCLWK